MNVKVNWYQINTMHIFFLLLSMLLLFVRFGQGIKHGRWCEHKKAHISCKSGQYIHITKASYGRHSTSYCGWKFFYNRHCHAYSSLHHVRARCDKKLSCTVPVSNGVFGDPCKGTVKYLEVSYECRQKPVDGGYSEWKISSKCSVTCGGGIQSFTRTCTNPYPAHGGKTCERLGPSETTMRCNTNECPVNGGYSEWTEYGNCSENCGGGIQTRTRTCTDPTPKHGGLDCTRLGPASSTRSCNEKSCPINGGYSDWTEYGNCSKSCGGGIQTRTRTCTDPTPKHGGLDCTRLGPASSTRSCNEKSCPINGGYSDWTEYGNCSKSCGGGIQTRTRTCTDPTPKHGGLDCTRLGPASSTRSCNEKSCPINGGYSDWTEYGNCSKSCGGGIQTRTRTCTDPTPKHGGLDCTRLGPASSTRSCNEKSCPVNGGYTKWSPFGKCSRRCGCGTQTRSRSCTNPSPKYGGLDCVGPDSSTRSCNRHPCRVYLKRVCQGKVLKITCPSSYRVHIQNAMYGRMSRAHCGWRFYYNQRCKSRTSLIETAKRCNNKRSCSIPAMSFVFGNPCFGTRKYLEVLYSCK